MANQGFLGVNPGGAWVATGNPATVNESSPEQPGQLGQAVALIPSGQKQARQYRYVKRYATDSVTWATGQIVFWQDVDDAVVTGDTANEVPGVYAGVALGTLPAAGSYGFVQEAGVGSVLVKGTPTTDVVPGCVLVVPNNSTAADCVPTAYTATTQVDLTAGSAAILYSHRIIGVALSTGITTGITVPTAVTALINAPFGRVQF
jgi:hypothetical protein